VTKPTQRILVIIDGSNFYHKAKKLAPEVHLSNLDYIKLCRLITELDNFRVEYCVGEIKLDKRNPKSERLYSSQQALFYQLEKQQVKIEKGYILKVGNVYHEKGVDVRIALDILKGALKDEFDICFIVSSDTDILPAVKDAIAEGKEVVYVGFEDFFSWAMSINCSRRRIITKKMLEACQCTH